MVWKNQQAQSKDKSGRNMGTENRGQKEFVIEKLLEGGSIKERETERGGQKENRADKKRTTEKGGKKI